MVAKQNTLASVALWAMLCAGSLPSIAEAALVKLVEYVGDHVFLTAHPGEIAALDSGLITGWTRTGLELWVHDAPGPGLVPVCRFYSTRFAPHSQHFLTAFAAECEAVKANADWIDEGIAFHVQLPETLVDGALCPAETHPIYRWYNGGRGGVPRHALSPYGNGYGSAPLGGRVQSGWVSEGLGTLIIDDFFDVPVEVDRIAFCAALDSGHAGLDAAKVEAGHLDLVKGTRWTVESPQRNAITVEFAAAITERSGFRHLQVVAGDRRGEASWSEAVGQLSILLYPPGGTSDLRYQLLFVSLMGRTLADGCFYEQGYGGLPWNPCEIVVGRRQ